MNTQNKSTPKEENNNILLERLIKAHHEDNLTLFIGAGISKTVINSKSKLWKDATKEMQLKLNVSETDPLYLAQLLFRQYPDEYYSLARSMIDPSERLSDVHRRIGQMHPRMIITTNWDCLIEKAVRESFKMYDVITCDEELLQSHNSYKIIKMHGDFARRDNRFVFKEEDYLNYTQNYPLIETYVKSVLITSNILFLGYSYNDINLKMIMTWIKQKRKNQTLPLYVIAEFAKKQAEIDYLRDWGIETYIYPHVSQGNKCDKQQNSDSEKSMRVLHLLDAIINERTNKNELEVLLKKFETFDSAKELPFSLLTGFIPLSMIQLDANNNPILLIGHHQSHSQLIQELHDDNNMEQALKLKAVLRKAGITNILIVTSDNSQITNELWESDKEDIDYLNKTCDIEDVLSFKKVANYKTQDLSSIYNSMIESFDSKTYIQVFIQAFNLDLYQKLHHFMNDNCEDISISLADIQESLPNHLKRDYHAFLSYLNFNQIKHDTIKLLFDIDKILLNINKQKQHIYCFLSCDSIGLTESMLLNFLRFAWINEICIDYWSEVKQYVFLSIKKIICLNIVQNKSNNIVLRRFEISALIHYVNSEQFKELFSPISYNTDSKIELILNDSDSVWLIDEVLPNLVHICSERKDFIIDGTQWFSRIGYVFDFLAQSNNDSQNILKKAINAIIVNNLLTKDVYNILEHIIFFLQSKSSSIDQHPEIVSFLSKEVAKTCVFIFSDLQTNIEHGLWERTLNSLMSILHLLKQDGMLFEDQDFGSVFLKRYKSLGWEGKVQYFQWFLFVSSHEKSNNTEDYIQSMLLSSKDKPIDYYIFILQAVLAKFIPMPDNILQEICESPTVIDALKMIYHGRIEMLYNLLEKLCSEDFICNDKKDDIKSTLSFLTPQSTPNT